MWPFSNLRYETLLSISSRLSPCDFSWARWLMRKNSHHIEMKGGRLFTEKCLIMIHVPVIPQKYTVHSQSLFLVLEFSTHATSLVSGGHLKSQCIKDISFQKCRTWKSSRRHLARARSFLSFVCSVVFVNHEFFAAELQIGLRRKHTGHTVDSGLRTVPTAHNRNLLTASRK